MRVSCTIVLCSFAFCSFAQTVEEQPHTKNGGFWTQPDERSSGPLKPGQKFQLFVAHTANPIAVFSSAASAGLSQARDTNQEYGQGAEGYGKRFGAKYANTASTQFFGTFLFPAILHQDPRYFRRSKGTAKQRIGYALTRTIITRTDSGGSTPNTSLWLGLGASAALSNTYYPPGDRSVPDSLTRFGTGLAMKSGLNVLKEYWPEIMHKVFKRNPKP